MSIDMPETTPTAIVRTLEELAETEVSFLSKLRALKAIPDVVESGGHGGDGCGATLLDLVPSSLISGLAVIHAHILLPDPLNVDSLAAHFDAEHVTQNLHFYLHYVTQWEAVTDKMQAANASPAFQEYAMGVLGQLPDLSFGRTLYNLLYAPIAHIFHLKNILESLVKAVCGKDVARDPSPDHVATCTLCSGFAKMRSLIAKLNSKMAHVKDKAATLVLHSSFSPSTKALLEPDLASRIAVRQGPVFPLTASTWTGALHVSATPVTLILFNDVCLIVNGPNEEQLIGYNRFLHVAPFEGNENSFVITVPAPRETASLTSDMILQAESAQAAAKWISAFQGEITKAVSLHLSTIAPPEPDLLPPEPAASSPAGDPSSNDMGSSSTIRNRTLSVSTPDRVGVMAAAAKRRSTAIKSIDLEALQDARDYTQMMMWIEGDLTAEYKAKLAAAREEISGLKQEVEAAYQERVALTEERDELLTYRSANERALAITKEAHESDRGAFEFLQEEFSKLQAYNASLGEELFKAKSQAARAQESTAAAKKKARKLEFVLNATANELAQTKSTAETMQESTISMFQEEIGQLKRSLIFREEELERALETITRLSHRGSGGDGDGNGDGESDDDGFLMVSATPGFTEDEHFDIMAKTIRELRSGFEEEERERDAEIASLKAANAKLEDEKRSVELQYHALAEEMAVVLSRVDAGGSDCGSSDHENDLGSGGDGGGDEAPQGAMRLKLTPDLLQSQSRILAMEAEIRSLKSQIAHHNDELERAERTAKEAEDALAITKSLERRRNEALQYEIDSLRDSSAREGEQLRSQITAYELRLSELQGKAPLADTTSPSSPPPKPKTLPARPAVEPDAPPAPPSAVAAGTGSVSSGGYDDDDSFYSADEEAADPFDDSLLTSSCDESLSSDCDMSFAPSSSSARTPVSEASKSGKEVRRQCSRCLHFHARSKFSTEQWVHPVAGFRFCNQCLLSP